MNGEVVNEIFKRRPARDFLRLYPSEKWKQLIPDIFEIGVLNLKNSFGTYKFTNNQIKEILLDLRNYKPEINEEEINTDINNNNYQEEDNNNNNENEEINENIFDEENFNNDNNNEEEEEYIDNDNNEYNNINQNNIKNNINTLIMNNKINNNNFSKKEDMKETTADAEVFIPDAQNIIKKVNYNRPKIAYNSTMEEIREKNIENKRNLGYTESKIKYQIMNDKRNHQMKKRRISNDDNNDNDGNFSFNQNKNKREKNMNKNYVINFDKKLNPQRPIEKGKNKYEFDFNNFGNYRTNNINMHNNNYNI